MSSGPNWTRADPLSATRLPAVSIVVPVLNDAESLARLLRELSPTLRDDRIEMIVADGGSTDGGPAWAAKLGARVVRCPAGRGQQLCSGVEEARGAWIWLLHADSAGVSDALHWLLCLDTAPAWGRFNIRLTPGSPALRLVAAMMNLRSRFTGICTGDQGIFVHRRLLEVCGGIPPQPLMEDIELSRRLKAVSRPLCAGPALQSSSRRWHTQGIARTVLSMWRFRLRYWLGADPEMLAREYYR